MGLIGQGPNFALRQLSLAEGCGHLKLPCGNAARPDLLGIIRVFPVSENGHSTRLGQTLHLLEKFGAAKETTIGRVRGIRGVLQFLGLQYLHREIMPVGKREGGLVFGTGKAGRIAQNTGNLGAQSLVGSPKKKGGVNPS